MELLEYNRDNKMGIKKKVHIVINGLLLIVLFLIVFTLMFLCPKDWLYPETYSDNVTTVIRALTVVEVLLSGVCGMLNKNKVMMVVLVLLNVFVIYKFASTFIIM